MVKRIGGLGLALWLVGAPMARAEGPPPDAAAQNPDLFPRHRLLYAGGGLLALGGVGLGLYAQAETRRAQTLASASDTAAALDHARTAAASANLMYGLAGLAIVYGVALELLPEPAAEKASLTFHF